ncbi:MAG: GTPase Der [Alphaproteobacteria bacterium MarineAlpha3_Bin5]|nr:ribosome biogenesis GTPase Der [Magnetovibrio sp.]PPR77765.1 MAG: GTPase Der [Alphaproteobacteria bacterium MarineAlpha3_Bin5]
MLMRIVIVGRPNVGKSTLFNRFVGKRIAIVNNTPGITRDRREGKGQIGDLAFIAIDTAGFEENITESLKSEIRMQTVNAIMGANLAVLLYDAKNGVTPMDRSFANWLRKFEIPVILIANKCEGRVQEASIVEGCSFGFGNPVPISAEHGEGMADLYSSIKTCTEKLLEKGPMLEHKTDESKADQFQEKSITQIAIVGRPNVGKSTLLNQLIGQKRMVTGPIPGITRDTIGVTFNYKGQCIKLFDTAGLRKKARITDKIENLSNADTLRAIKFAQVVILLLEPNTVLEKQDLNIARIVIKEGRGLLIAINKWDACKKKNRILQNIQKKLQISLPQIYGVPVIPISALTGYNVDKLFPKIFEILQIWNLRVSTGKLNKWLKKVLERHPPPLGQNGRRIAIRYATQIKTRPPTFSLHSSSIDKLPRSYFRYLMNALRSDFDILGVPIRLHAQKNKNPYD